MTIKILADQGLPGLEAAFPNPFTLSLYANSNELLALLPSQDILICRSTLKVNAALLQNSRLKYVATASSGRDHIDEQWLQTQGISLLDAKGSNASSVADYILSTLAYLSIYKGFSGKKAGLIGCGAVGQRVKKRLQAAGFDVRDYDPPKAEIAEDFTSVPLSALIDCDLICVHANLHDTLPYPSYKLLNADFLSQLKPGTVIINAARGGIVDEEALCQLEKPLLYCTDVYSHEPAVSSPVIDLATLCTPHIAGHSLEAKQAAIYQVSQQLHTCYRLKAPNFKTAMKRALPANCDGNSPWQDLVLSLYNPVIESQLFKAAENKETAFLDLRKSHQFRHDFNTYDLHALNKQLQDICGFLE